MLHLIHRLLRAVLLVAAAAALYVIGTVGWSWWHATNLPRGADLAATGPSETRSEFSAAAVEIRVTSHKGLSRLFQGQPFVFDVVLINLEARWARNREPAEPGSVGTAAGFALDHATTSWEQELALSLTTSDGISVLEEFDWTAALLEEAPAPSGRRLGIAPARATFILNGVDLAELTPGLYVLHATLPPDMVPSGRIRMVPLAFEIREVPTRDIDRAIVTLAVAEVATLRGEFAAAINAARTALKLDPLQNRALTIIAEAYEIEGDLQGAVEWYERYLATIPNTDADYREKLADYIDALRRQVEP